MLIRDVLDKIRPFIFIRKYFCGIMDWITGLHARKKKKKKCVLMLDI